MLLLMSDGVFFFSSLLPAFWRIKRCLFFLFFCSEFSNERKKQTKKNSALSSYRVFETHPYNDRRRRRVKGCVEPMRWRLLSS